jgi:hypothetical protein
LLDEPDNAATTYNLVGRFAVWDGDYLWCAHRLGRQNCFRLEFGWGPRPRRLFLSQKHGVFDGGLKASHKMTFGQIGWFIAMGILAFGIWYFKVHKRPEQD